MGQPRFVESSPLTKFCRRIGVEWMAEVEAVSREQLIDMTAMEKEIA